MQERQPFTVAAHTKGVRGENPLSRRPSKAMAVSVTATRGPLMTSRTVAAATASPPRQPRRCQAARQSLDDHSQRAIGPVVSGRKFLEVDSRSQAIVVPIEPRVVAGEQSVVAVVLQYASNDSGCSPRGIGDFTQVADGIGSMRMGKNVLEHLS